MMLSLDHDKVDQQLNDFNIAQLQLQFVSKEEIELAKNVQDFKFPPTAEPISFCHPMLEPDIDYNDRRMSTSAASGISTATTDTAASTSRVAGEKRASSPDASPRNKRARPTLSLDSRHYGQVDNAGHPLDSLSPRTGDDHHPSIRTPEPPSSASASIPNTAASESGKVHLPPIYATFDSPSPASAHSMHHLQPPSHHHMSIGGNPSGGAYGTVGGLAPRRLEHELRRGSLPNLYSESLSVQRGSPMGTRLSSGLSQGYGSPSLGVPSNRSNFTFSQPYSTHNSSTDSSNTTGGLSSYQFPAPPSPPNGSGKQAGEEYYSASSAASSGFPQTPLDTANAGDYGSTAPTSAPASAIVRPNSTPGQLSANSPSGMFGSTAPPPRLSGHHGSERKGGDGWYSQGGMLSLPSASSPGSTGTSSTALPTLPTLPSPPQQQDQLQSQSQSQQTQQQQQQQQAARPQRRRGKLPKPTTDFLKDWLHRHSDHPYPSEEEKKQLCNATGLSMSQVSNWMINARRRILAPANRAAQGPTTTVPFPSNRSGPGGPLNNLGLGGIGGGVGGMSGGGMGGGGGLHNIGGMNGGGGGLALSHLPGYHHHPSTSSSSSAGSTLYDVGMGMGGSAGLGGGMGGRRASMPAALSMGGMGVNDMHSHHPYSQSSSNNLQLYHSGGGGASSGNGSHNMHSLHSSPSSDYLRSANQSQLGMSRHTGYANSGQHDIYGHRNSLPYSHSHSHQHQQSQHHQTHPSNPAYVLSPATYSSSPGGNGNSGRLPALASVSATRGYSFPDNNGASEVGSGNENGSQ